MLTSIASATSGQGRLMTYRDERGPAGGASPGRPPAPQPERAWLTCRLRIVPLLPSPHVFPFDVCSRYEACDAMGITQVGAVAEADAGGRSTLLTAVMPFLQFRDSHLLQRRFACVTLLPHEFARSVSAHVGGSRVGMKSEVSPGPHDPARN